MFDIAMHIPNATYVAPHDGNEEHITVPFAGTTLRIYRRYHTNTHWRYVAFVSRAPILGTAYIPPSLPHITASKDTSPARIASAIERKILTDASRADVAEYVRRATEREAQCDALPAMAARVASLPGFTMSGGRKGEAEACWTYRNGDTFMQGTVRHDGTISITRAYDLTIAQLERIANVEGCK